MCSRPKEPTGCRADTCSPSPFWNLWRGYPEWPPDDGGEPGRFVLRRTALAPCPYPGARGVRLALPPDSRHLSLAGQPRSRIHETGHLVFVFGGEFLTLLGGTLFQLIVPIAFVVALWRRRDHHGATVPLWWVGQSCWNISVYVQDARAQELPLVGGGEHDWANILGQLGWLEHDQSLGRAVWLVGVGLYVVSIFLAWRFLSSDKALGFVSATSDPPGARRPLRSVE